MILLTISHLHSEDFYKALSAIKAVAEDVQFIRHFVRWKKVAAIVISLANNIAFVSAIVGNWLWIPICPSLIINK